MLLELFANANLSAEQKEALKSLEQDLMDSRRKLKLLETKVMALEEQADVQRTVLTRPEFNREVARMLAFDERYGGTSSVVYIDVDTINGLAAHEGPDVAEEAVRLITHVLIQSVRRSDIVGRLAGDEFGVLLVRCDNAQAWKKGRELAASLSSALEVMAHKKQRLTVSFGAYTFREDDKLATGIQEAAQALTRVEITQN